MTELNFERIRSWIRSLGYLAVMGLFGLIISSLGPVLPDLSIQVNTPFDVLSMIFTARALGFLVGSQIGGKLLDKFSGHPLLTGFFLLLSIMTLAIPLNATYLLMVGLFFIQGITLGFVVVGASTLIVWEHSQNTGPWINAQSFINAMGGFLSPLIISISISRFGSYSFSFWFYALLACLFSAYFFFIKSPKIRETKDTDLTIEKSMSGLVYLAALVFLLYVGAESSINGWVFSIASAGYSIPAGEARLLNSIFWGCIAIGRLAGIWISRKIQPERILVLAFCGSILSLLPALICPYSIGFLWAATVGMGLCMALIFPSLMTFAEKRMRLSGKNTGLFFSATSIGGMLIPWISGQFFTRISPHAVKGIIITSLIGGFAVFLLVRKRINT